MHNEDRRLRAQKSRYLQGRASVYTQKTSATYARPRNFMVCKNHVSNKGGEDFTVVSVVNPLWPFRNCSRSFQCPYLSVFYTLFRRTSQSPLRAMYSASTVIKHADQTSEAEKSLQKQKFEEIVGVLLSAGYFRARIATLSPFDKVRLPAFVPTLQNFRFLLHLLSPLTHATRSLVVCAGASHLSARRSTWTCSTQRTRTWVARCACASSLSFWLPRRVYYSIMPIYAFSFCVVPSSPCCVSVNSLRTSSKSCGRCCVRTPCKQTKSRAQTSPPCTPSSSGLSRRCVNRFLVVVSGVHCHLLVHMIHDVV